MCCCGVGCATGAKVRVLVDDLDGGETCAM